MEILTPRLLPLKNKISHPLSAKSAKRLPRDNTNIGKNMQNIDMIHNDLANEIDKMNKKIKDTTNACQDDLLLAYKVEMQKVERDYQEITNKINSDREISKSEQKLIAIREELNWFRNEAIKFYNQHEQQKTTLKKMKAALEVVEEDRDFFQQQLLKNRKINKHIAIQIKAFRKKYPQLLLDQENDESGISALKDSFHGEESFEKSEQAEKIETESHREEAETPFISQKASQMRQEQDELLDSERACIATINKLKKSLDVEKKAIREIRAQMAADNMEKSELKEFFLTCIEEIRKDIVRKRGLRKDRFQPGGRPATQSNKLTRITSAEVLPKFRGVKVQTLKKELPIDPNADKSKVVEMMLSNESVLHFLYESMFPPEKPKKSSAVLRGFESVSGLPREERYIKSAYDWRKPQI